MKKYFEDFSEIVVVDFEFFGNPGDPPTPICCSAKELKSGKLSNYWLFDTKFDNSPYNISDDALFIAYYAPAEMSCHIVLNWPRPKNMIDLYAEYRNFTNGKPLVMGDDKKTRSLLAASAYFGIRSGDATLKDTMRDRILEGPPYSEEEKNKIMDYCSKDIELTSLLFEKIKPHIDVKSALLRGRYMYATAKMENYGIPLDLESLQKLRDNWDSMEHKLIDKINVDYGVYVNYHFSNAKFCEYLNKNKIPWDVTPKSGLPRTDDKFLEDQCKTYPILRPLRELKQSLSQLKLNDISVGSDGRHRAMLSPFGTLTGRHSPSSARYIFGNSQWVRHLIKPFPGYSLAYCDFEQQEIGIAAALSGDENLLEAYNSGDPYIAFAKQAGVVPKNATKNTHPDIRERFKTCSLALNYGMHYKTFAMKANLPEMVAKEMFNMHKITYRRYWEWIENFTDAGQLTGKVSTIFGWDFYTRGAKIRTLQNYPMQANGSEILRLSVMLLIENGIRVVAPVHDAVLIEAKTQDIDREVDRTTRLMVAASERVIGIPLRVEADVINYPDHYTNSKGKMMWNAVWEVINDQS